MNVAKTAMLMTGLIILFLFIGGLLGGRGGATIALIMAVGMNFFAYYFSDKLVLAMYGAKPITEADDSRLFNMVKNLTLKAHIPMPRLYVIPTESPNAFATGRNPEHAAVAVTQGIRRLLSDDELEGVISHELAHVKNRDILVATIAATFAGAITHLAQMALFFGGRRDDENRGGGFGAIFLMILAPIAAILIQMAISRGREFLADESGAKLSGRPMSLANALLALKSGVERIPIHSADAATSHMFIVNPFTAGSVSKLFSTHPPVEERVDRLSKLARRVA